jgi:Fe-S cluster biogenesis protein NfuA/nitrite reductase/ring-hydroxylating ferredoxin subunit
MTPSDAGDLLERLEQLTAALEELDPGARALAEELMAATLELYGAGLERILEVLDGAGEAGAAIRAQLVDDGVVASLLLIHDLYPVPLEDRVAEALSTVRPYLESHGGDVELLGLEEGVARLRLVGHCNGCPASSATLELAIEQALSDAAPDLLGLEVEGVAVPAPPPVTFRGRALDVLTGDAPAPRATPEWLAVDEAESVVPGSTRILAAGNAELLVANVDGRLLAYDNRCADCGAPLGDAVLEGGILTCAACGGRYDLPHAGRALADGAPALSPIPLLRRASSAIEVAIAR